MRAMRLHQVMTPLVLDDIPIPVPAEGEVLIRVSACAVCRTDLHIIDGDLPPHRLPLVPGHEIVGVVAGLGPATQGLALGDRVGVTWLGGTCGVCRYCRAGRENLCDFPVFTGYDRDGGYAEYCVARAAYCVRLPLGGTDEHIAPLMCAGLIGFRSYRRAAPAKRLGLVGFGAAAHIIAQVAQADGIDVYAFTRPGDVAGQEFARRLGAVWSGGSDERPAELLDAAIIFAPDGGLVPLALRLVRKGGSVIAAGIHMSDVPSFPYGDLWGEREIASIANLTRADAADFFARFGSSGLQTNVTTYPLERANEALRDLREGGFTGAAVLVP
ncbi:zinc-dependent alcohol dehydrogenase family protein [Devosia sp. ZB163]|uniref:zinc-dependent alcohol dehydrogenase family protein n=1 Tax=Devosia sp. ZB163 TaxID=3025938 RepID=UPI00235FF00B|nr:zinc-dependent alcohol dehydrogenase family protein [Devosia sp. ZB163]MDC9825795.1 zinc-dependent alcohol dehydrogenase family protein [Devosia sp. ZB163]